MVRISCFRVSSRARSPQLQLHANPGYKFGIRKSESFENYDTGSGSFSSTETAPSSSDDSSTQSEPQVANRIMVVVDSSRESKGALQWALSHTVLKEDTVVLLHIAKPSKNGPSAGVGRMNPKVHELLLSMKSICETKRPGVHVEVVAVTGGKEKGPVIVAEAKKQKATLLVLGHRRRSIAWRLVMRWVGSQRSSQSIVDYCIQKADCMTIADRLTLQSAIERTRMHPDDCFGGITTVLQQLNSHKCDKGQSWS